MSPLCSETIRHFQRVLVQEAVDLKVPQAAAAPSTRSSCEVMKVVLLVGSFLIEWTSAVLPRRFLSVSQNNVKMTELTAGFSLQTPQVRTRAQPMLKFWVSLIQCPQMPISSQNIIPKYGPKISSQNIVLKYCPKISSQNICPKYRPKISA